MFASASLTVCSVMIFLCGAILAKSIYLQINQIDRLEIYDNEVAVIKQYTNITKDLEMTDISSLETEVDHLRNLYKEGQGRIKCLQRTYLNMYNKAQDLEKMQQSQNINLFELITLREVKNKIGKTRLSLSDALKDLQISTSIGKIIANDHQTGDKIKTMEETLYNYSPNLHKCTFIICISDIMFFHYEVAKIEHQLDMIEQRRLELNHEFNILFGPENNYYRERSALIDNFDQLHDKLSEQIELAPIFFLHDIPVIALRWSMNMKANNKHPWMVVYNDSAQSFHFNEPDETIYTKTGEQIRFNNKEPRVVDLVIPVYLLKEDYDAAIG